MKESGSDGSAGFSRENVEATIDSIIASRLQDPVAPQLDLFAANRASPRELALQQALDGQAVGAREPTSA